MAVEVKESLVAESPGVVKVEESAFFFFGDPKWGKTELSAGWPNTIHLVTSAKEISKLQVPYILVNTHAKFKRAVDELCSSKFRDKYKRHKTVVIDVLDTVYTNCEEYVAKEIFKVKHIKDIGYGKGEARVDTEFRNLLIKLVASRFGVVLISHNLPRDYTDIHGNSIQKNGCTLPKRIRTVVLRDMNVIGFCTFDMKKVADPATGKVTRVRRRVIEFKATEEVEAGDRDGYLPSKLVIQHGKMEYHKTYQKIEEYYELGALRKEVN